MKRALSLFVPVLALVAILAPATSASAVPICPAQVNITGCGCGVFHPVLARACTII